MVNNLEEIKASAITARNLLFSGRITYEEAAKKAEDYINMVNGIAKELASKNHIKYKSFEVKKFLQKNV